MDKIGRFGHEIETNLKETLWIKFVAGKGLLNSRKDLFFMFNFSTKPDCLAEYHRGHDSASSICHDSITTRKYDLKFFFCQE
jgi:hypothetical protein